MHIVISYMYGGSDVEAYAGLFTTVTVDVEPLANGFFNYQYTVSNLANSDLNVDAFTVNVDKTTDLTLLPGSAIG